jgi:hypothetical protein
MQILEKAPVSAGKTTKKAGGLLSVIAVSAIMVFSASCQKESDARPESLRLSGETAVSVSPCGSAAFTYTNTFGTLALDCDGDVYQVTDFLQGTAGGTGNPPHNANQVYYYSFATHDGTNSVNWDLRFTGTANADVYVDTTATLEYTTTAFGSISGSTSWTLIGTGAKIGFNRTSITDFSVNTTTPGWYNYDFSNHKALPLVENGQPLTLRITYSPSRIYIVELQDIYSGGTPNSTYLPTNYPYLKFRYYRQ